MNVLEPAILYILKNNAGIVAIVGTRIYFSHLPEDAEYPALVYFEVSGIEMAEAEVGRPRYQFSCYAETDIESKQLSNATIKALKNISGVYEGINIPKTIYLNRNRIHDPDMKLFDYPTDILFIYKE